MAHGPDRTRRTLLKAGAGALGLAATAKTMAQAQAPASALPPEVMEALPAAQALGSAKLRFLGMDIYEARLWATSSFPSAAYAQNSFALELIYARSLSGALIAERSLKEMRRQGKLGDAREKAWLAAMVQAFPDVGAGDRITGLHRPGAPARFWFNGQSRPPVADADFSLVFFGIWLSDATSEPAMRERLLGRAAP